MTSKIGFWRRRAATEFEPASIAQLIQVELLPRQLRLAQIQGASLLKNQFLKSFVYRMQKILIFFLFLLTHLGAVESISVIVPCHPAHFPLLEELLTAYAEQSLIPNEVVISLSEYTKIAPASIAALETRKWPFKLILLKQAQKYPAATNRKFAFNASHGDLLLFQDADDLPHPQRVEIVKSIFEHNSIQHLIHSFVPDGGEFTPYSADSIPLVRTTSDLLIHGITQQGPESIPLHHGNICLTRIATMKGQWKPTYEPGEDLHFNIAVLAFFPRACYATSLQLIQFRSSLSYFSNTPPELR